MAGPTKRSRATSALLFSTAITDLTGIPAVTRVGQQLSWRQMFSAASPVEA